MRAAGGLGRASWVWLLRAGPVHLSLRPRLLMRVALYFRRLYFFLLVMLPIAVLCRMLGHLSLVALMGGEVYVVRFWCLV